MKTLPKQDEETYLGDGLYVSFDGYNLKLRAPRDGGDHFVALEPEVYIALRQYVKKYANLALHFNEATP